MQRLLLGLDRANRVLALAKRLIAAHFHINMFGMSGIKTVNAITSTPAARAFR
jgi:hypothetical protein